ncbi:2-dehydro-3-deoxy-D-gluconate 5-dehydrogenase KduD [Alkalibacterium iburiense]|uniref:2-dehydro-3-deoxy-D-gluconate 5-dehydrogenase KduD n=1 Tax=Alkalibacterium iburiense TaxID=290589 RepID=A0ABP3GY72_9LACT
MDKTLSNFSLDLFSLRGKVAIVTGASKGLGQAYAVALAKVGAKIFVATHSNDWQETEKLLKETDAEYYFYEADLTDKSKIDDLVKTCVDHFGTVDILVNNAGTIVRDPIIDYKDENYEKVISINQHAVYYLSQRVAKQMVKQQSGKIINIASMLSFQGGKFVPPYTASKHAVVGLTKAFANELAVEGIQVNAIAPGYVKTNNTAPIREDEKRNEEILSQIPAAKWAEPYDLMGAVVYLASPASDYVNGHVLAVDGGWLAR